MLGEGEGGNQAVTILQSQTATRLLNICLICATLHSHDCDTAQVLTLTYCPIMAESVYLSDVDLPTWNDRDVAQIFLVH